MSIDRLEKNSNLYSTLLQNHFFSPFLIQSLISSKQNLIQTGSFLKFNFFISNEIFIFIQIVHQVMMNLILNMKINENEQEPILQVLKLIN